MHNKTDNQNKLYNYFNQKIGKINKLFIYNEELNQIVFGKGLFASIKQHIVSQKGT